NWRLRSSAYGSSTATPSATGCRRSRPRGWLIASPTCPSGAYGPWRGVTAWRPRPPSWRRWSGRDLACWAEREDRYQGQRAGLVAGSLRRSVAEELGSGRRTGGGLDAGGRGSAAAVATERQRLLHQGGTACRARWRRRHRRALVQGPAKRPHAGAGPRLHAP